MQEVKRGKGWTLKGDIFSFGSTTCPAQHTLFTMLTEPIGTIEDLYQESKPRTQLTDLLKRCLELDPTKRPSSLTVLEIVREYVVGHERTDIGSLHSLLGTGSGGYLLQSLLAIASGLDEYAAFGEETALRRKTILERLKLLCEDGAGDLFYEYSESLHLSVLLGREGKLNRLLSNGRNSNVNEKWKNSGWTPLHLAEQQDRQDMVALLDQHGADSEVTDKYARRPNYYRVQRA